MRIKYYTFFFGVFSWEGVGREGGVYPSLRYFQGSFRRCIEKCQERDKIRVYKRNILVLSMGQSGRGNSLNVIWGDYGFSNTNMSFFFGGGMPE